MDTGFTNIFRHLSGPLFIACLTACTGGSGSGGDVTLATSEQSDDPVVLEIPVAYIIRPLPELPSDLRDPLSFAAGARLIVRERASATADELDVTQQIKAIVAEEEAVTADSLSIDIKGLESSYDGGTLIFSARVVPEPVDGNLDQTTWNLWTFDFDTMEAQYLIPSRIKRNEGVETGGGQDIDPHFLSDDRIVFSSTRQVASQARQLNEGRGQIFAALVESGNQPAAVLHIYDPQLRDTEFKQISFNRGHDLNPTVLSSGEIVFSRWNDGSDNHISIFRIHPSGGNLSPLYGYHSQNSGTADAAVEYTQVRELDDGRLVSLVKPFASDSFGGEIVIIDALTFSDQDQLVNADQSAAGTAQESLTDTEIRTDGTVSRGGQYASVYPLRDGTQRLLVTWSDCRVFDEDADPARENNPSAGDILPCTLQPDNDNIAAPQYGAWVYDPTQDTQRPVVIGTEGFMVSEFIAAEPRGFPALVPQADNFDANLALENNGRLLIDSVYDLDGTDSSPAGIANHRQPGTPPFTTRPARFLRIVQPVPIPDRDVFDIPRYAFGVSSAFSFREIAGYVPIEPDGSVTAVVNAGRPFSFSVLDANGRRIGRDHNYWLQVAAGETLHCAGCHSDNNSSPHGRTDAQIQSSNSGAIALASGITGFPGTNVDDLFAIEPGETMAQTWNFHRPLGNATEVDRRLSLEQDYTDEWSAPELVPDPAILDRAYDPAWTTDNPLVVNNLDPTQASRIVINYIDHIHPIWERVRTPVTNTEGVVFDSCIGCHTTEGDTVVAAGQLDLTALPSDIDPDHYRSYRELLSADQEQWITLGDAVADRQRVCTSEDADGNVLISTETLSVPAAMRAGSANGSGNFFNCFSGSVCGLTNQAPLPENCTEDGGTPVTSTRNTVDHSGILSAAELRLISEWLDIGAQYYNNPFDPRLSN
jgi:hypothetical protein